MMIYLMLKNYLIKVYRLPMGDFTFTTGHIFACDPVVNLGTLENLPYFRSVEPGTYPVETLVAELGPNDLWLCFN